MLALNIKLTSLLSIIEVATVIRATTSPLAVANRESDRDKLDYLPILVSKHIPFQPECACSQTESVCIHSDNAGSKSDSVCSGSHISATWSYNALSYNSSHFCCNVAIIPDAKKYSGTNNCDKVHANHGASRKSTKSSNITGTCNWNSPQCTHFCTKIPQYSLSTDTTRDRIYLCCRNGTHVGRKAVIADHCEEASSLFHCQLAEGIMESLCNTINNTPNHAVCSPSASSQSTTTGLLLDHNIPGQLTDTSSVMNSLVTIFVIIQFLLPFVVGVIVHSKSTTFQHTSRYRDTTAPSHGSIGG